MNTSPWTPLQSACDRAWNQSLRLALRDDRLSLHAQAICDPRTGAATHHELLVRMIADDGSPVLPGQFLPAAERSGLVVALDLWVIRRALRLVAAGHAVQVNVSAVSLGDPEFVDAVTREVERVRIDPSLFVIELTETARLGDPAQAARLAGRLVRLGCRLALDDFGTGYAALHYLKALPAHFVKIDRSFTQGVLSGGLDRHIVAAVIDLAAAAGMRSIAEGVEDEPTLRLLTAMGVDLAQGYLLHRPEPVPAVFGDDGQLLPVPGDGQLVGDGDAVAATRSEDCTGTSIDRVPAARNVIVKGMFSPA